MRIRGISATFLAALLVSASLFSSACDLSCAFSQLPPNCGWQVATTPADRLAGPMRMEGMNHTHCAHEPKPGRMQLATIRASSGMGLCQHQPCDKPASNSLQRIVPTAPQVAHAVLTGIAPLQPGDSPVVIRNFNGGHFSPNLSALNPLSTTLRI